MTVVAVVIGVIVLLVLSTRTAMRRAQKLRTRHRDSLRLLANELDDRYDLVPALIAASAGAGVERSRISPLVGARTLAIAMRDQRLSLGERAAAENTLSATLHELIGDPDQGTHWPFIRVARELQNREVRIAGAARVHNDLAHELNRTVSSFPSSVFAKLAGVTAVPLFEVAPMPEPVVAVDAGQPVVATADEASGTVAA
ncbi:LemA family protein [Rhodococcus phenolicus]|uniref:LemA family protein n=1 Tax=Rhodococcus phenolicus TaxID=263849 RepID=UPI001FE1D01E|nr:LemA family protein [Rhodococcus phenolicus]